jgi:hypothetical protein
VLLPEPCPEQGCLRVVSDFMPPPLTDPRQIYRALLRECTYLPDPIARTRTREHVISSFRIYVPRKGIKGRGVKPRPNPPPDPYRQSQLLRKARSGLSTLQRANEGYPRPLLKVLCHAYGQAGKRRHELMKPLLKRNLSQVVETPSTTALATAYGLRGGYIVNPQLEALIRSRAHHASHFTLHHLPVKARPNPKTNIWGRPMPQKRLKNLERKKYAKLLEGLCPPLPEKDWNHLQSMALDKQAWKGPIPRRPGRLSGLKGSELPTLSDRFLTTGPIKGHTFESLNNGRPHELTKRYMHRVWQTLFNDCCKMSWDQERKVWKVEWGFKQLEGLKGKELVHEPDTNYDAVLFEPVNSSGQISNQI